VTQETGGTSDDLDQWRKRLGLTKRQLARLAEISPTKLYEVLKGEGSPAMTKAVEDALRFAEENPDDTAPQPAYASRSETGVIEFEVTVDAVGLRVFVRGPVANADDLERQAAKVFREIQRELPKD
jgi:transcriptional regulator with XRE-family HTH domain